MKIRYVATTSITGLIAGFASLITSVLVARVATTTETGHFAQYLVFFNIFYIITNLGLAQSATYSISAQKRSYSNVIAFQKYFFVGLFCFVGGIVAWVVMAHSTQIFVQFQIPPVIFILSVLTGTLFVVLTLLQGNMYGLLRYDAVNVLNIIRTVLPIPLIGVVAIWYRTGAIFAGVYSVAMLIAVVVALFWSASYILSNDEKRTPTENFTDREMFRYGGFVYGANLFHYLSMRGLVFLIGLYGTVEEVGFFGIALLLVEGILLVPNAIGQVIFPASPTLDLRSQKIDLAVKFNLVFGILAALGFLILGKIIINIVLGARYRGVFEAMLWMVPAIPLLAVPKVLSQILSGKGAPQFPFIAAIVSFCASAIVGASLLPHRPLFGAAVAVDAVALMTFMVTISGYCILRRGAVIEAIIPSFGDLKVMFHYAVKFIGSKT